MFAKTEMSAAETFSAAGRLPVHGALALRAWAHPAKRLFTFLDDEGEESGHLSYLDLWRHARAIGRALSARGEAGERVMLFFPPGLDFIAAFLGCLMSGRIAVPINLPTRRRADRCVKIILDSGATAAMAPSSLIGDMIATFAETEAADLNWIESTAVAADPREIPETADAQFDFDPNGLAFLQYTSGSTSSPKGVMVSHGNISTNLRMMRDSWALDHESDMVFWQPHHHDMGLILGQLLPIVLGNHSVLMAPNTFVRQPSLWLRAISRYRAKLAGGPNFAYDLAVERYAPEKLQGVDLSCWDIALNGADMVRATTLERFHALHHAHGFRAESFLPCFGLAEATLYVSGGPRQRKTRVVTADPAILEQDGRVAPPATPAEGRQFVGCGEPSWEVEVAIVDPETGRRRGPDETGEVWISGKSVASGYWRNEAATSRSLRARLDDAPGKTFLRTGDLGFLGGQDKQLYICGRLKDLIICDGRNLHPEDIEYSIVEASDALKPQSCAVFAHDDANEKPCIVAAIEVDRDLKRRLAAEAKPLQAAIRAAVANDHGVTLGRILFVLPSNMRKTTSGKIQRGVMRRLYLDGELEVLQP